MTMTTTYATTTSGTVSRADLAATLLRVTSGAYFLVHAAVKIFIFTPAGTVGFFQSIGLPGPLAYLVIALELLGGLALVLGVATRFVAPVLAVLLLGTIYSVHGASGFGFSNAGGGWEYPAFWAVTLAALALLGDGAYSIGSKLGR
jgi:putative oxidoreductase